MPCPTSNPTARRLLIAVGLTAAALATAAEPLDGLKERIEGLARSLALPQGGPAGVPTRVEIEVGQLDPRLRLAPCEHVEPYLPAGLPAWGHTRIGLKCTAGAKAWNVTLPITVHAWRRALVLNSALPAGTVLEAGHLAEDEVDLSAAPGAVVTELSAAVGRTLARTVSAGSALRLPDLKVRQWFAAGETVRVVASGPGWSINTEGQALSPGLEGQTVRVRTESGRLLQGRPVAERQVEVSP